MVEDQAIAKISFIPQRPILILRWKREPKMMDCLVRSHFFTTTENVVDTRSFIASQWGEIIFELAFFLHDVPFI